MKEKILYEYAEGSTRPAGANRLPHLIFLGALSIGLLAWAFYAFFTVAAAQGYANAFLACQDGLFAVLVCIAICFLSVFPLFNRKKKPACFTVYADKMIVRTEKTVALAREEIARIRLERRWAGCVPTFERNDGSTLHTGILLSSQGVLCLKKLYGDRVRVERTKGEKAPFALPVLCLAVFVFIAGIAVTVCSIVLHDKPPRFIGVLFIAGGCIVACAAFERAALVKEVITPALWGIALLALPTELMRAFALIDGGEFTLASFFNTFSFNALNCGWVFLTALGAYFFVGAIACCVRYIRYKCIK